MSDDVTVKVYTSPPGEDTMTIAASFSPSQCVTARFPDFLIDKVVTLIAERYVSEHYAEIITKLDQQAIANLAIADAGKKIAEEIRTRPVVITQTKNEVSRRFFR